MNMSKLFDIPLLGKAIRMKVAEREGGEKTSATLREYIREKCRVDIGMYTYGGCFDLGFNVGERSVKVGKYCSLGQNIRCFGANHPMEHAVMSAYFYNAAWSGLPVKDVPRSSLEIGHDVWIGYGTIITSKCTKIGNGAAIGAGSIITKDVPAYSITVGSPAKVLKYRFDQETIDLLERSEWWDLTPEELMEYYELIEQPKEWARAIIHDRRK